MGGGPGKLRVAWGDGHLELRFVEDWLEVLASNYRIVLAPRSVEIHGEASGHRESLVGKRKYIYVELAEGLKPLRGSGEKVERLLVGGFEVTGTDVEFSRYLTIITPGFFLYNYAILTDGSLALEASARREAYFDEGGGKLTLYLV